MPLTDEQLEQFDAQLAAEDRNRAGLRTKLRKPRTDLQILVVGSNLSPLGPNKLVTIVNPDLLNTRNRQS